MTTPFDMIGQKELAPTCTAIADAGGTSVHAAWMRKPGNAATLVAFINSQMGGVNTLRVELYENERGTSNYGPPKGWTPKSYEGQHGGLRELWSQLDAPPSIEALLQPYMSAGEAKGNRENGAPQVVLPDGEEGFFFGAKLSAIARIVKGDKGLPDYNRVLKYLFGMLRERRSNFKDWTDGNIGEKYEKPLEAWWKRRMAYEATIQGDFAAYAGQTGIAYRNWSVRAARAHMEQGQRRVGMTSFDAAQILLFHEECLTKPEHLAMDCAGTERAPGGAGDFRAASYFRFEFKKLYFRSSDVVDRGPDFGSASFCLPGVA
jgi:hypothetical protein